MDPTSTPTNPPAPPVRAAVSKGVPLRSAAKALLGKGGQKAGPRPTGDAAVAGAGAAARAALVSLSWTEQDIENRWGVFKGGRYTSVNKWVSFLIAAAISAAFLGLMTLLEKNSSGFLKLVGEAFMRENNLPATVPATLFFFWGAVIVLIKMSKLRLQRRALDLAAVPQSHDFFLNEATARTVLERMHSLVDDTRHFILLNRIDRALSSLHNIGGVSDVSVILKSQAENDENHIASSYALIHAMIWAIPVLGFVGTVLGLMLAMSNFNVNAETTAAMRESLGPVVKGLSTAFQTTLVGLVFALILHLLSDLMHQRETDFMDECNDYCHAHVVSKLRVRAGGNGPS